MTGRSPISRRQITHATLVGIAFCFGGCQSGETIVLGLSPPSPTSEGAPNTGGEILDATGGDASGGNDSATGGLGGASSGDALPLRFGNVTLVAELSSRDKDDNPTLTGDLLQICFTSTRANSTERADVWCAERADRAERFDEPVEIGVVNSDAFETSPALSLNGLDLWFSSDREGGAGEADIYVASRTTRTEPFGTPVLVPSLNSEFDDIPRPPAMGDTVMPLGSRRTDDTYFTYLATRPSRDAPFGTPVLIEELTGPGLIIVDAQLSEDGLLLLYTSVAEDDAPGDLYATMRPSLREPFGTPVLLEGVNSPEDDRDPWLSPDGSMLYFSSNRSGDSEIYSAERIR